MAPPMARRQQMQLGLETWQIAGSCSGFTISTSARVAVRLRQKLCLYCREHLVSFEIAIVLLV